MKEALPELGVQARIGVNTGEVVAGTEERLATGDAVNVAARMQQAAEPAEILIGPDTRGLPREAADTGEERLLELKGRTEPIAAAPLTAIIDGAVARRLDVPIVGRARERRALAEAWERASSELACHLFTVLGTAGVGKSRLGGEFLAELGDARVARGRCLSYGEGITYWPVVEIVMQLRARPSDPRAAAALASLLGESETPASVEEIAWAFRRLLEEMAAEALYRLRRDDEAQHWTDVAEQAGAEDDVTTQRLIRQVRAKFCARRAEHAEAERLACEALALSEPTDMLAQKAEAYVDLAEVLAAAGRRDEASAALADAAALYREKGHVVGLRRAEEAAARLSPTS